MIPRPGTQRILEQLAKLKRVDAPKEGWLATCPAHADTTRSLWIREGQDRVLLVCRAKCAPASIAAAIGLTVKDLFFTAAAPVPAPTISELPEAPELIVEADPPEPPRGEAPLYSESSERAVVAALLMQPGQVAVIRPLLEPDDFFRLPLRRLYHAILGRADRGEPWDPILLARELQERGVSDTPRDEILRLLDYDPYPASVEYHGKVVLECAQRRALAERLERDLRTVREGGSPASAVAGALQKALEPLAAGGSVGRSRFQLVEDDELDQLPPLTWLVDGMLPAGALLALFGAPGSGKSFLSLGLACALATGTPWLGHPVVMGRVLYVAAEGLPGVRARVQAWKASRGYDHERLGVSFIREPIDLMHTLDPDDLVRATATLDGQAPLRLVVIDTLGRSMPGGDENNTKDMSLVIEHADRIRRATGAAVMLVHHSKKDEDLERGSSVLRASVDTLLLARNDDGDRTLLCEKQKDAEPFSEIPYHLHAHPTLNSCVAEAGGNQLTVRLSANARRALATLLTVFPSRGATATEWLKAAGVPDRAFYRARARLVEAGLVSEIKQGHGERYHCSASGRLELSLGVTDTPLTPVLTPSLTPANGSSAGGGRFPGGSPLKGDPQPEEIPERPSPGALTAIRPPAATPQRTLELLRDPNGVHTR